MFWPTGRCPFRCRHCDLPILSEKRNEMTLEEITTFFERSRVLRELPISIAGGEPFIRRDMIDILRLLTDRNHPVFVTSNGWYLDQLGQLGDLPRTDLITIGISIDGIGATHDAIRRRGSFERVTRAIDIVREAGCQVQINTVVQPENLGSIEEISDYFQRLGVNQVFIPLATFPGMDQEHLAPADYPDALIADVARWANSQPTDTKYVLSRGDLRITDCHAGTTSCYIDPEGDVYACMTSKEWSGWTDYRMGSLREADLDFDAVWLSDRAWAVREAVKACPGCYVGCELSRETNRHGLGVTLDDRTLIEQLHAPSSLRLDDPTSSPFLTGEWYWRETGFRWTGQQAGLRLTRPAASRAVEIRTRSLHPDLDGRAVRATVLVEGTPVGHLTFDASLGGIWVEERFDLPQPLPTATGLAEIRIEVDRTWVPKEAGNSPDRRRLGLMVERVGFVP